MLQAWVSEMDELIFMHDWEDLWMLANLDDINHWIHETIDRILF